MNRRRGHSADTLALARRRFVANVVTFPRQRFALAQGQWLQVPPRLQVNVGLLNSGAKEALPPRRGRRSVMVDQVPPALWFTRSGRRLFGSSPSLLNRSHK